MAENITIDKNLSRDEKYRALLPQIESLIGGEEDLIANLANISASLMGVFNFHWVGFYLEKNGELVLGPFQGPVACTRIPLHKGVCGAVATARKTIIVEDVTLFPGHIACSPFSKSEIVVPLVKENRTILVLDIDSDQINSFDKTDQVHLEKLIELIGLQHYS